MTRKRHDLVIMVLLGGVAMVANACGDARVAKRDAATAPDASDSPVAPDSPVAVDGSPDASDSPVAVDSSPDASDSPVAVDSSPIDASSGGGEVMVDGPTTPPTTRDGTAVQRVALTAAQVFMQPTAPFLVSADLARTPDGLFELGAKVMVAVSGCTGDACNRQVTLVLSRAQTTQVERWLAVIPGEACRTDPGPICDFGVHYAVGIDGPPQNQTCCKRNEWGQNGNVERLHGYLQDLAVARLEPLDGGGAG